MRTLSNHWCGGRPVAILKCPPEMGVRQFDGGSNLADRYRTGSVSSDVLDCPAQLPWRQPTFLTRVGTARRPAALWPPSVTIDRDQLVGHWGERRTGSRYPFHAFIQPLDQFMPSLG